MNPGQTRRINRQMFVRLSLFALLMFGFGYAMVPYYKKFCEITGINRRGLIVAITEPIRLAIEEIPLSSSTEAHPHHHRTRRQVGGKSQRA